MRPLKTSHPHSSSQEDTSRDLNPLYNNLHGEPRTAVGGMHRGDARRCRRSLGLAGVTVLVSNQTHPSLSQHAEATLLFGRGMRAGIDRREQKKQVGTLYLLGRWGRPRLLHAVRFQTQTTNPNQPSHLSRIPQIPQPKPNRNPTDTNRQAAAYESAAMTKMRESAGIAETADMRVAAREREDRANRYDGFDMNVGVCV